MIEQRIHTHPLHGGKGTAAKVENQVVRRLVVENRLEVFSPAHGISPFVIILLCTEQAFCAILLSQRMEYYLYLILQ